MSNAEFSGHNIELIDLNIRNLDLDWVAKHIGGEEVENDDILYLLESLNWGVERLASGRINDRTLNRVRKMIGGWCIKPFYGLADRHEIDYFRFKPLNPPMGSDKRRYQKYLGAVGASPRAYAPNVSGDVWMAIASKSEIDVSDGSQVRMLCDRGDNFWEWILNHPEIPVVITEGEKKSYAGLLASRATISLPGIDCGYVSSSTSEDGSSGSLALIPDLAALAVGGRSIYIAFDRDTNPSTVKRVQKARSSLGKLFGELGCKTLSIAWDEKYKGLDDLIIGDSVSAFDRAFGMAKDITPKSKSASRSSDEDGMPAIEMADLVSEDVFNERIKYDAISKQYWRYNGSGMWVLEIYENVFGEVQEYIRKLIPIFTTTYVKNVLEFSRKDYAIAGWIELPNNLYMPFVNGVLDLSSMELLPHCQSYGFRWQLPRSYCPDLDKWDSIDKFLNEMSSGNSDLKNILIAFCNAVLIGRSDLQRFLYLFGSGGNGKGVLMRLLRGLVGDVNTCTTDIGRLNDNSFESARLEGKRLALVPDSDRSPSGVSVFRSATGEDSLRSERKGKDAYDFTFRGMFVVAANKPTFVGDADGAMKRRKIDFPCLMKPSVVDTDLDRKLADDMTAFTTYLLSIDREWVTKILENANRVDAVMELNWEMTIQEDSIAAFMSSEVIVGSEYSVKSSDLYEAYKKYCDTSGMKPKSSVRFTPDLINLCTNSLSLVVFKKKTNSDKQIVGLRIKSLYENAFQPILSQVKPAPSIESVGLDEKVSGSVGLGVGFKPAPSIESVGGVGLSELLSHKEDINMARRNNENIESAEENAVLPDTSDTFSQNPPPSSDLGGVGLSLKIIDPTPEAMQIDLITKTADRLKKSFEYHDIYRLKTIHNDTDPSIIALAIDSLDEPLQSQVRKMIKKEGL